MKNTTTWSIVISLVVVVLVVGGAWSLQFLGGAGTPVLPGGNTPTNVGAPAPAAPDAPKALTRPATPPKSGKVQPAPTQAEVDAAKAKGTQTAVIKTAKGTMEAELYGADAPLSVANFVKLAKAKYYDGLTFHRVETNEGFQLIQGGDPNGDGSGGPGYEILREISPKLRHVEGALAMASCTMQAGNLTRRSSETNAPAFLSISTASG